MMQHITTRRYGESSCGRIDTIAKDNYDSTPQYRVFRNGRIEMAKDHFHLSKGSTKDNPSQPLDLSKVFWNTPRLGARMSKPCFDTTAIGEVNDVGTAEGEGGLMNGG